MTKNNELFTTMPVGKAVAKLAIPTVVSQIIVILYSLADTFFIGQIGDPNQIAAETGLAKEYVEKYAGYTTADTLYGNAASGRDRDGQSDMDKMWFAQKKVVTDLAEKEPCVIVGRCADYILRNTADCLTVFIHASDEKRAERIVTVYGQREESPIQRLHDKDQKRKEFYELYTGTQWGQADNYDLCLDSGRLGIELCVDMIAALYQQRCSKATAT